MESKITSVTEELGVSRQAVSKWESGTTYPEMDKLILMTRLFKCTLDDLVNRYSLIYFNFQNLQLLMDYQ